MILPWEKARRPSTPTELRHFNPVLQPASIVIIPIVDSTAHGLYFSLPQLRWS